MARGRMIDKRISMSKKLGLISDKSKVLYFMLYPHLDKEGRIGFDDLEDLKDEIMPKFKNWGFKKIAESLNELADIELILLYANDEKIVMEFSRFKDFQTGLRADREAPSQIKSPDEKIINSGGLRITPALRLSKVKLKEGRKEGNNTTYAQNESDSLFEKWWFRYPRKEGKGKANEKWNHLVKTKKVDPQKLEDALTGYINCLNSKQTPIEFIMHAKTFLYPGKPKKNIPGTWEEYEKYANPKYRHKPPL